jgi:hypothetical protein
LQGEDDTKFVCRLMAGFVLTTAAALCSPITYTFTGTGTGELGSTPFSSAPFTVTVSADTSSIFSFTGGVELEALSSTISVSGLPLMTFTDTTSVADNQSFEVIVFGDFTLDLALLDKSNAAFATYALATSIGPISLPGPDTVSASQFVNIPTNQGALTLTASNETFLGFPW